MGNLTPDGACQDEDSLGSLSTLSNRVYSSVAPVFVKTGTCFSVFFFTWNQVNPKMRSNFLVAAFREVCWFSLLGGRLLGRLGSSPGPIERKRAAADLEPRFCPAVAANVGCSKWASGKPSRLLFGRYFSRQSQRKSATHEQKNTRARWHTHTLVGPFVVVWCCKEAVRAEQLTTFLQ